MAAAGPGPPIALGALGPNPRPSGVAQVIPALTPPVNPLAGTAAIPGVPVGYGGPAQGQIPWDPATGVSAIIDQSLNMLQNQIQGMKEQRYRFAEEIHRIVQNLLVTARNNGNGTTRVNTQALTNLDNALVQATGELADTTNMDQQAVQDTTGVAQAQAANLQLGGWTPKPRRKPTRRRPKRKSLKSPF